MRLRGEWPGLIHGSVVDVVANGNRAYAVVDEGRGTLSLVIIDVTPPASPMRVGSYPLMGPPGGMFPVGETIYMMSLRSAGYGLDILDVSEPGLPVLRGRHEIADACAGDGLRVRVDGSYAYITVATSPVAGSTSAVLEIVNVGNPADVRRIARAPLRGIPTELDAQSNYVYVAEQRSGSGSNDFSGFEVFDVSNPARPLRLGGYDTSSTLGDALGIQVRGSLAFIVGWTLHVVDIADPAHPVFLGDGFLEGAHRVRLAGTAAYVAGKFPTYDGWAVLSVENPGNPVLSSEIALPALPQAIAFFGDHAFVAGADAGLISLDTSDPLQPIPNGSGERPTVRHVYVEGHHAYAALDTELAILDVTNPTQPRRVGSYPGGPLLQVVGNRGYLSAGPSSPPTTVNAFEIVDLSNPARPVKLGRYQTDLRLDRLQVVGDRAYVTQFSSSPTNFFGLEAIDVADPASPIRVSRFVAQDVVADLEIQGTYAFAAGGYNDLRVLDISNPLHPVTVATYNSDAPSACPDCAQGTFSLALIGNYVLVVGANEASTFDVSRPLNPVRVSEFFSPNISHLGVKARHGYLATVFGIPGAANGPNPSFALVLQDWANPTAPKAAGVVYPPVLHQFDLASNHLYVSAGQLFIYEVQPPPILRARIEPGSRIAMEWVAAAGLRLERSPVLNPGEPAAWVEVPGTDGRGRIELPLESQSHFFRLMRP